MARKDATPEDRDDILKAETARLIAEMDELIRRAKVLMQEHHPSLSYTARQMLTKAAELVGGRNNLAGRLNVPQTQVDRWIGGSEAMPETMLLALISFLDLHKPGKGPRP
jgi:hypothetical protein